MLNQYILRLLPEHLQKRIAAIVVSSVIKEEDKLRAELASVKTHIQNDSDINIGFGSSFKKEVEKFMSVEQKLMSIWTMKQRARIVDSGYAATTDWESVDSSIIEEASVILKVMNDELLPDATINSLSNNQKDKSIAISELVYEINGHIEVKTLDLYNKLK